MVQLCCPKQRATKNCLNCISTFFKLHLSLSNLHIPRPMAAWLLEYSDFTIVSVIMKVRTFETLIRASTTISKTCLAPSRVFRQQSRREMRKRISKLWSLWRAISRCLSCYELSLGVRRLDRWSSICFMARPSTSLRTGKMHTPNCTITIMLSPTLLSAQTEPMMHHVITMLQTSMTWKSSELGSFS